jgi:dolichol-phosphate mannosyltransferase
VTQSPIEISAAPTLSVVIPALNEVDNLKPLIDEIMAALAHAEPYEIIVVDDGSTDGTSDMLRDLVPLVPPLAVLRHRARSGQSAAMRTGVKAAKGAWIMTLDGDGQNDPADMPKLLGVRDQSKLASIMVVGNRVNRKDTAGRRIASRLAFGLRLVLLGDDLPDTGCSLKLFRRDDYLELPAFNHMHRFLGALMRARGVPVASIAVNHRPRRAGVSKYTNWGRALVGAWDILGVIWLIRRTIRSNLAWTDS